MSEPNQTMKAPLIRGRAAQQLIDEGADIPDYIEVEPSEMGGGAAEGEPDAEVDAP